MKILMSTSEWPSKEHPLAAPFVVRQVEYLRAQGVEVEVFHFRGRGNPLNYWRAALEFREVQQKFKPDIIHAQWGQSVIPALPKKHPLVITYRGDDLEGVVNSQGKYGLKSSLLKRVGKYVSRFADHIILVSPHLKEKLNVEVPITIIPSGLELHRMPRMSKQEAKAQLGLPADKKIILFPNNPQDPRKNLALVEAVLDLLSEEEKKDLLLLKKFGISHDQILLHQRAADFLIFTSLHEGSPNVVKEALANDVAVIGVPVGDLPYRLPKIPGCFLAPSYDPQDLAKAFRQALQYDYSNYNLRPYIEDLAEDKQVEKLMGIYKSLLKKR